MSASRFLLYVGLLLLLVFVAESEAHANQFRVTVKPRATEVIRSQILPADKGLNVTAYVNGRPLRQELTDNKLGFTLRGRGVAVILQAQARRGRARIELANFRRRHVRILVRVRPVPLPVEGVEPVEPDPVERVCVSAEDTDCIDPNDEATSNEPEAQPTG